MEDKVYHFKAIGDVTFVKKNSARSLRITVKPLHGVKVTIPRYVSLDDAFQFVNSKTDWIQKSLEKMKISEDKLTIFRPDIEFSTYTHQLQFEHCPDLPMKAKVGKGYILIQYPNVEELEKEASQAFIKKTIEYTLRKEAKKHLPERTLELAKQHGFTFADLRVKNLKTRWGSCSHVNNINLNIHLMRLPNHLIDYVIVHELTHTIHKNHGKGFWKMLDEKSGNAKQYAKEMKNYRTTIF